MAKVKYRKVPLNEKLIQINKVSNFYLMKVLDGHIKGTNKEARLQAFDIASRRGLT